MSRLCYPLAAAFPLLVLATFAGAQESPTAQQSFVERMDKGFARRSPKAGELLPNAVGFDFEGRPFALDDTRGKLTVLVTGCLT